MRSTRLLSWSKAVAGLAPRPVPPHVFALGEERVRYARLPRTNGTVEVEQLEEVELGPEVVAEGSLGGTVREGSLLKERLRQLIARIDVPVQEASLVLPDAWIRLVFAETGELPRSAAAREEILRFKLKRLVPFRVEDLRLRSRPVPTLAGQQEPCRELLAFGLESTLQQIESAFAAAGVHLGEISNASLALLAGARETLERLDLAATVYAGPGGYSLTFTRNGEPMLYRFKALAEGAPLEVQEAQVGRDLRLTRKFVQDRLEDARLRRVWLLAGERQEARWREKLEEAFAVPVNRCTELPAFAAARTQPSPEDLAPMMGAACRSV